MGIKFKTSNFNTINDLYNWVGSEGDGNTRAAVDFIMKENKLVIPSSFSEDMTLRLVILYLGREKFMASFPELFTFSISRKTSLMPSPSEEDLGDPMFNAVWKVIKDWDIGVPEYYEGYTSATGSHVKLILDAVTETLK